MVKAFIKTGVLVLIVFLVSIFCCAFNFSTNQLGVNINQLSLIQEEKNNLTESGSNITVLSSDFSKGTVEGGGRYEVGDSAIIKASPVEGCHLVKWQIKSGDDFIDLVVDGELYTKLEYSFIVDGDCDFKAVFEFSSYDLYIDFTDAFKLTSLNYSYDENRFSEENIDLYPRATITNFEDGKFYYNDIISLNYSQVQDVYVKKLNVSDFYSSDKKIAVVNISVAG